MKVFTSRAKCYPISQRLQWHQTVILPTESIIFVSIENEFVAKLSNNLATLKPQRKSIRLRWTLPESMPWRSNESRKHFAWEEYTKAKTVHFSNVTKRLSTTLWLHCNENLWHHNKALESWILRPFSGWRYCFHGHSGEIRDSIKRDNRHSD